MATFKSTQYTDETAVPARTKSTGLPNIWPKFWEYITVGTEATADIIQFGVVPKGWYVALTGLQAEACGGTAATINLGISGTATAYMAASAITAAGSFLGLNAAALVGTGLPAADTVVQGVLAGITGTLTAAKKIRVFALLVKPLV